MPIKTKPPRQTPYDLWTIMDFGKHYGEYIKDIIQDDPDYLAWCLDTILRFRLTEVAEKELDEVLL